MVPQWLIEKKRDGLALTGEEIRFFINGYTGGSIPDYQMSAMAMAVFFRGMTSQELAVLTDAMMNSGDVLDTSAIAGVKVDKHSTGGIGDKVSLVLAPLAACEGVVVPMISGRGLGITGGTLDKLESIPGYRTDLPPGEFLGVLDKCGCSIIGQTADLAPADKKLYALRDVTATVPSVPLISASIMCKKLAEGIDALVLDVKSGQGAFMKSVDDARTLARAMVGIGERMGKGMSAVLTDMNQPLGRTAGNALEVAETIDALQGRGPADLMTVTFELGAEMLRLAGKAPGREEAIAVLQGHIDSGAAYGKFMEMVRLQGGDADALQAGTALPRATIQRDLTAAGAGVVCCADAESIGRACVALGAGRTRVEDAVDHAVGISNLAKIGEEVGPGRSLATVHANDAGRLEEALRILGDAFEIADRQPDVPVLVKEIIASGESGS